MRMMRDTEPKFRCLLLPDELICTSSKLELSQCKGKWPHQVGNGGFALAFRALSGFQNKQFGLVLFLPPAG